MKLGKISAALGMIAVICISLAAFSISRDVGANGPITFIIEELISNDGASGYQFPELTKSSLFDVNESNIRLLLKILTILISLLSGAVAIMAASKELSSLWYSIGIFASFTAITEINYLVAGVYAAVFLFLILRSRNWKMSIA